MWLKYFQFLPSTRSTCFYMLYMVKPANFMCSGESLVSAVKHVKYSSQSRVTPEGYYIQTHSSTKTKVRMLERIFDALGVKAMIVLEEKE